MALIKAFFLILFASIISVCSFAETKTELMGSWLFYKYKYQDHESPAPNPRLQQIISFNDTGNSRLYYKREDEDWFCDRMAVYTYSPSSHMLYQQVVWVNPQNHSSCAMDPDMQMGRKTENVAYANGTDFYLEMPLNDQIITFIWKKINQVSSP